MLQVFVNTTLADLIIHHRLFIIEKNCHNSDEKNLISLFNFSVFLSPF